MDNFSELENELNSESPPDNELVGDDAVGPNTAEQLGSVMGLFFAPLGFTPDQVSRLSVAYAPVIDKWFPDGGMLEFMAKFAPEITAATVTWEVFKEWKARGERHGEKDSQEADS